MTYLASRNRPRRARARYGRRSSSRPPAGEMSGMGGWLDVLSVFMPLGLIVNLDVRAADALADHLAAGVGTKCIEEAETQTSPMEGTILDIRLNWNPTPYFEPADVRQIVNSVAAVAAEAMTQISGAPRSTSDADTTINNIIKGLQRRIDTGQTYLKTATDAQIQNIPVEAPDIKDWVLSMLRQVKSAMVATHFLNCSITWIERALGFVMQIMGVAWDFIKGVGGLVLEVATQVAKVPDLLSSVVKYGTYAAVGVGAWWLYKQVKGRTG